MGRIEKVLRAKEAERKRRDAAVKKKSAKEDKDGRPWRLLSVHFVDTAMVDPYGRRWRCWSVDAARNCVKVSGGNKLQPACVAGGEKALRTGNIEIPPPA